MYVTEKYFRLEIRELLANFRELASDTQVDIRYLDERLSALEERISILEDSIQNLILKDDS